MTHAPRFSPRELEIARLMAEGLTYREIAGRLGWRRKENVRRQAQIMAAKIYDRSGAPSVIIPAWYHDRESAA